MRSPCVDLNGEIAVILAEPGVLLTQVISAAQAPENLPNSPLEIEDANPPLPPVANVSSSTASPGSSSAPTASSSSSGMSITAIFGLCLAAIMALTLLSGKSTLMTIDS
ncbi:hypothetical protein CRYUN_Cryun26dG0017800 [Craigia yunnanensis]